MNIDELRQAIEAKKQEIATIQNNIDHIKVEIPAMTEDDKDALAEQQSRAAADAMMGYDPETAQAWLDKAESIKTARMNRIHSNEDKADIEAQRQKDSALTELANIDTNNPDAQTEWTATRNKWLTKNPKLDAYLPSTIQYIDAKGNFGAIAQRTKADSLRSQAKSKEYLATTSKTDPDRKFFIDQANALYAEADKLDKNTPVGGAGGMGGLDPAIPKLISEYEKTPGKKIPQSEISKFREGSDEYKKLIAYNDNLSSNQNQTADLLAKAQSYAGDVYNRIVKNNTVELTGLKSINNVLSLVEGKMGSGMNQYNTVKAALRAAVPEAVNEGDITNIQNLKNGSVLATLLNKIGASQTISDNDINSALDGLINSYKIEMDKVQSAITDELSKTTEYKDEVKKQLASILSGYKPSWSGFKRAGGEENTGGKKQIPPAVQQMADKAGITGLKYIERQNAWFGVDANGQPVKVTK